MMVIIWCWSTPTVSLQCLSSTQLIGFQVILIEHSLKTFFQSIATHLSLHTVWISPVLDLCPAPGKTGPFTMLNSYWGQLQEKNTYKPLHVFNISSPAAPQNGKSPQFNSKTRQTIITPATSFLPSLADHLVHRIKLFRFLKALSSTRCIVTWWEYTKKSWLIAFFWWI